jgi:hypothetical protein
VAIVALARHNGKKIRVVGAGHSWAALVPTDHYLVFVSRMNRVRVDLSDPDHPRVQIEAGASVADVNRELAKYGLAIPSNVVLESVLYGGLIATGCHGSGWDQQTLSDMVYALDIVTASGKLRTFRADRDDADVMNAARLNLGLFGILHQITLNVVKSFRVHQRDQRLPWPAVIREIKHWVEGHDYCDLFWWPFNPTVWVKTLDRTEAPITARPRASAWNSLRSAVEATCCRYAYEHLMKAPHQAPSFCQKWFRFTPSQIDQVVDVVEGIHYRKSIERAKMGCLEFGFSVDAEFQNVQTAWEMAVHLVNQLAAEGRFPLNLTLNARFIKNSDALLSPAFGQQHTCFIEVLSYYKTPGWKEFTSTLAHRWMKLPTARPHWAKEFDHVPGIIPFIRQAYGSNLSKFLQIREELAVDPEKRFVNSLLDQIFFAPV